MSTGNPNSDDPAHAALTNQHTQASPPRYTLEHVAMCFSIAHMVAQISTQNAKCCVYSINYLHLIHSQTFKHLFIFKMCLFLYIPLNFWSL